MKKITYSTYIRILKNAIIFAVLSIVFNMTSTHLKIYRENLYDDYHGTKHIWIQYEKYAEIRPCEYVDEEWENVKILYVRFGIMEVIFLIIGKTTGFIGIILAIIVILNVSSIDKKPTS